jgi:UDP-N-acetylglucosamine/UDP-N-acetylgalactosamine diphosphorylase
MMKLKEKYDEAMRRSEAYGQAHLLRFYGELGPAQRESLLDQMLDLDFELICGLYRKAAGGGGNRRGAAIGPAVVTVKNALAPPALRAALALGADAMRAGKFAVVTMAGGQGTRLGHDGPKGTFKVGLPQPMTLFEAQLAHIRETADAIGAAIPWYILTSEENHAETVAFFEEKRYFGYPDVTFFRQGSLPMISLDGRLLLEEKHSVKRGPDGNGSVFKAMLRTGVAEDMARRGVEWFYIGNIDNILARCADPLPVGLAMQNNVLCASKSILKRGPGEKAGVFCRRDGRPCVVEYTEISGEMAGLRDGSGNYVYGDAHISCTVFHTDVLKLEGARNMPYHTAVKRAPHIGPDGGRVLPEKPNAYKFESFIFDVFPLLKDMVVLRVDREEEFAPIKNPAGEDSPESARALYLKAYEK